MLERAEQARHHLERRHGHAELCAELEGRVGNGGALERPTGLLSAGGVAKWAAATYGFGTAYAKAQPGRTLAELAAAADPEACTAEAPEPVELDVARAVHEACLLLQGAVAAEEEGGEGGEEEY